ncbi:MAG TPA: carboxypeptidase-like regulatory domain-containing protein, partial [Vicinamibacterales bacterium]|nr:carboxypeptidase-like regulatory domain-containing protein [Vicinamibacterales bacterium]
MHLAAALLLLIGAALRAADHTGQVTFTGLPVPGATITATQGEKVVTATSNEEGFYRLNGLADGTWTIKIEMSGFAPLVQDVAIAENGPPSTFELKLLAFDEIKKVA